MVSLRTLRLATIILSVGIAVGVTQVVSAQSAPKVGDTAADFELPTLDGKTVKLSNVVATGPVVLVVLRGFPGYQCPVCNQQVGQFLGKADAFKAAGATVLLVYPGAKANLTQRAGEFMKDKSIPEHFQLLVDGDYKFTNAYNLRWDAPNETAYPSTFIIQKDRKITYAVVSKSHGGRTKADDVLKALTVKP